MACKNLICATKDKRILFLKSSDIQSKLHILKYTSWFVQQDVFEHEKSPVYWHFFNILDF